MRQGTVGASGDDRRERGVAAELADPRFGGAGDLALAASGEATPDTPLPDLVGELGGPLDQRQLALVLDLAELLDQAAGDDGFGAAGEFRVQFLQRPHRHLVVFDANPAGEVLGDASQPVTGDGDRLPVAHFARRTLGVAEVGEEEPDARPTYASPIRAGEAGQVADVGEVGDQQPVEVALEQQRLEPVAAAAHQASTPSSAAIRASASL